MKWYFVFILQWLAIVSGFDLLELVGINQAPAFILNERDNKNQSEIVSQSSKTTSQESASTSIDPALPAGGVNLLTPTSASSTYIKSGQKVTFKWNYTSLILSPTAINVEVSCAQNSQVYTLARNQSIKTSSIVWDTNEAAESGDLHLITADYTLVIYDESKSPSDVATAGELAAFDYSFGVYIPQKYTPWPAGAKYVNISIRLSPPLLLTFAFAAFASLIVFIV